MTNPPSTNEWLTAQEVAEEIRIPVRTLSQWRYLRQGPRYAKFGKHIRYRRSDVAEYERRHTVEPQGAA